MWTLWTSMDLIKHHGFQKHLTWSYNPNTINFDICCSLSLIATIITDIFVLLSIISISGHTKSAPKENHPSSNGRLNPEQFPV